MEEEFKEIKVLDFVKKDKKDSKKVQQTQVDITENDKRYYQLLQRAIELSEKNPALCHERHKLVLKFPQSNIFGIKTTILNFNEICKQINRHPEHVMYYFSDQVGKEGLMKDQAFIIKVRLKSNIIKKIFTNYIFEYVICRVCKSHTSQLIKDSKMRLWNLHCHECKSIRTVFPLKGFNKNFEDYQKYLAQKQKKKRNDQSKNN